MLERGYFLVPRGLMGSPEFETDEPSTNWQAYIWSIEQASIKDHDMWFNGVKYHVKRGEFVTSIRNMAKQLGWSDKRARGFIDKMVRRRRWAKRRAHIGAKAPTVLIICDYEILQKPSLRKGTANGAARGKARAKQGHRQGKEQNHRENHRLMKGKKGEAASSGATAEFCEADIASAVEAWNANARECGWREVHRLSDAQRHKLGTMLAQVGLQGMTDAVREAGWSKHLGGGEPPSCFTFDTMLDPKKFGDLMNGDHDKHFKQADGYGENNIKRLFG